MLRKTKRNSLLIAVCALVVAGCGGTGKQYSSEPLGKAARITVVSKKSFDTEQQAVINKVVEYGDATDAGDYKKICDSLIIPVDQYQRGGCEAAFRKAGKRLSDFTYKVKVVKVSKDGNAARLIVDSERAGYATSSNVPVDLKKDANGMWRITNSGV